MTTEEIIKIAAALGPLTTQIIIAGTKITATFKEDITSEELLKALQEAKSANWPNLDFGQK